MTDWKEKYPYTLDVHLRAAMEEASRNEDLETLEAIWEIYRSYRKSEIYPVESK